MRTSPIASRSPFCLSFSHLTLIYRGQLKVKGACKRMVTDPFHIKTHPESRILIAEDCTIVRTTICALLENSGWSHISSSSSFDDAYEMVTNQGAFDLVLMDFNMPGMNGLSGLKKMLEANDSKPVGMISGDMPSELVDESVSLGACGFIPKNLPPRQIIDAIGMMSKGQKFSPDHFVDLTNHLKARPAAAKTGAR